MERGLDQCDEQTVPDYIRSPALRSDVFRLSETEAVCRRIPQLEPQRHVHLEGNPTLHAGAKPTALPVTTALPMLAYTLYTHLYMYLLT